jgi:hypothetical protein
MKISITKIKEQISKVSSIIKNKSTYKNKKIKVNMKIKVNADTVMSIIIIVVAVSAIAYSIINNNNSKSKSYLSITNTKESDKTSKKKKSDKIITIDFEDIDTSSEEYSMLTELCESYVYNNYSETSKLDTKVEINEEVYIDEATTELEEETESEFGSGESLISEEDIEYSEETSISDITEIETTDQTEEYTEIEEISTEKLLVEEDPNTLYSTGLIYMYDKLLARYINKNGKLHTVFAQLIRKDKNMYEIDKDALSNVEITENNDIYTLVVTDIKYANSISVYEISQSTPDIDVKAQTKFKGIPSLYDVSNTNDNIDETDYLNTIESITESLVNNFKDLNKYEDYFTSDEYDSILGSQNPFQSSNYTITVVGTGMSDKNSNKIDRIITFVYDVDNSVNNVVIYKLDSDNKIYDIDVL